MATKWNLFTFANKATNDEVDFAASGASERVIFKYDGKRWRKKETTSADYAKADFSNVATLPADVVAQLRGTDGTNGTNGTNGTTPTFSVSGDTLNITT